MQRRMLNRRQRRRMKKVMTKRKVTLKAKPKGLKRGEKDILLITGTFKGLYPNRGYMGKFEPMRKRITKALEALHFRNVTVTSMSQKKVGKLKFDPKKKSKKQKEKIKEKIIKKSRQKK